MTSEAGPISAEARRALEQELADLHAERDAVAATLGDTDSAGDSADQADELQRATQLDRVDARITEITVRLDGAAEAGPPRTDVVGPGSTATVRFADGAQETVQIGDVAEPLDQTLVTTDSPLGRALLGHRVGDCVSYEAPDGRTTVTVLSLGAP
jgi:transcription elongation GreA/GreB family factor